jgi:hypothetical protein
MPASIVGRVVTVPAAVGAKEATAAAPPQEKVVLRNVDFPRASETILADVTVAFSPTSGASGNQHVVDDVDTAVF